MLGDHFWPAMYPGLIVGFLVGLSSGNIISTVLGSIGGLLGAMALYFLFVWIGMNETILSLICMVGGAVVGAFLLMRAGKSVLRAS